MQWKERKPLLTLQQVQEIAKPIDSNFTFTMKAIRENARKVKEAFAWNPGYKEYFAVKATPTRLIQILHEEGFGCDCSSLPELQLSDVCGVKGNMTSCSPQRHSQAEGLQKHPT